MNTEALADSPPDLPSTTEEAAPARANWTAIYSACRMDEFGYSLAAFLENPWEALHAVGQEQALESLRQGFRPLLPEQARVARRLREEERALH